MYFDDYRGCHGMMNMYQPSQELVDLLIEAMKDERADRVKYGKMIKMTEDNKIRKQIAFAYEDEGKHYKMFQHIYHLLTGQMINIPIPEEPEINSLVAGIESSINGELEAVELYRKIKSMLPNRELRDMLYEIITDEQEHATRFVYLYAMLCHIGHHMENNMHHHMEHHMENHMPHHMEHHMENQMPLYEENIMPYHEENIMPHHMENIMPEMEDNKALENEMHYFIENKENVKHSMHHCKKDKDDCKPSKEKKAKIHHAKNKCKDDCKSDKGKSKHSKKRIYDLW